MGEIDHVHFDAVFFCERPIRAFPAEVLVGAHEHFVALVPLQTVGENGHAFSGAAGECDLVRRGADELRHLVTNLADLAETVTVSRILGDLAFDTCLGLPNRVRYRAEGAVVHERETVDDIEMRSDFPPIGLVQRSFGSKGVEGAVRGLHRSRLELGIEETGRNTAGCQRCGSQEMTSRQGSNCLHGKPLPGPSVERQERNTHLPTQSIAADVVARTSAMY